MNFGYILLKNDSHSIDVAVVIVLLIFVGGASTEENIYIQDLDVRPVPYQSRSLQLLVSWKLLNSTGVTFDVLVRPINMRSNDTCSERPCSVYSQNQTTILFPKNPRAYVDEECSIQPFCEYAIKVSTSNRKFVVNKNISIPECVEGICSCQHRELLPSLQLSAQIVSKHQINITWSMQGENRLPDNVTVEKLNLEIREQSSNKYIYLPIEHTTFDKSMGFDDTINTTTVWTLTRSLSPDGVYMLNGHLEDSRGCNKRDKSIILKYLDSRKTAAKHDDTGADEHSKPTTTIVVTIVLMTCIVAAGIIFVRHRKHRKKRKKLECWRGVYHNAQSSGPTHIQMTENVIYVDNDILEARAKGEADYLEIPHSCLTIGREIGKGAFGRVFIARAERIGTKKGAQIVAIKQLKKRPTTDELEEFLSEIATMKKVGHHPNIVSLLGCCTIKQPLIMIMEYVGSGDLLQYLRQVRARHEVRCAMEQSRLCTSSNNNSAASQNSSQMLGGKYAELLHHSSSNSDASYITQPDSVPSVLRPSVTETLYTMLSAHDKDSIKTNNSIEYVLDHNELKFFALQIARGMKHLEAKQITHRDLAARNILIDENKVLKISDFGLSRTGIYVNTKNKKVPLRWLSIEAMRDNLYSSRSDVWAYAIVLWEIGTLGGFPYPTIGNHELLTYLQAGNRLWKPENCSVTLYDLMLKCWSSIPEMRPTFAEIYAKLEPHKERIYIDFNELGPNYTLPPTSEQVLPSIERS